MSGCQPPTVDTNYISGTPTSILIYHTNRQQDCLYQREKIESAKRWSDGESEHGVRWTAISPSLIWIRPQLASPPHIADRVIYPLFPGWFIFHHLTPSVGKWALRFKVWMNGNDNIGNTGRKLPEKWEIAAKQQQEDGELRQGGVCTKTCTHGTRVSTFCADCEGGVPQSLGWELPPQRRH